MALSLMHAQGLSHHLMRRALSQEEGRERRVLVYVCVFTCVICNIEWLVEYIYVYRRFRSVSWRFVATSINHRYLASRMS